MSRDTCPLFRVGLDPRHNWTQLCSIKWLGVVRALAVVIYGVSPKEGKFGHSCVKTRDVRGSEFYNSESTSSWVFLCYIISDYLAVSPLPGTLLILHYWRIICPSYPHGSLY